MTTFKHPEKGNAMLVVLMIMILTTLIGILAINQSITELHSTREDRIRRKVFYQTESAINEALAIFPRIYANASDADGNRLYPHSASSLPLRDQAIKGAGVAFASPLKENGIPVAWIEVRTVLLKGNKSSASLSSAAENVPSAPHITLPPKGFSLTRYRGRRFAITATAIDPDRYTAATPSAALLNTTIQVGLVHAEDIAKVRHMEGL